MPHPVYVQLQLGQRTASHKDENIVRPFGPVFSIDPGRMQMWSTHIFVGPQRPIFFVEDWLYYDGLYYSRLEHLTADLFEASDWELEKYERKRAVPPERLRPSIFEPAFREQGKQQRFNLSGRCPLG